MKEDPRRYRRNLCSCRREGWRPERNEVHKFIEILVQRVRSKHAWISCNLYMQCTYLMLVSALTYQQIRNPELCVIKIYFTIRNGKTQPGARTFPRAAPGSSRQEFLVYVNTKRTALFFLPPGRALQLKSSNCKSMKITRRWRGHHSIVLTQGNFWI